MSSINKIRKLLTMNLVDVANALVSIKVPGQVITVDISAGWVDVGEGNILRLEVGADTYIAFEDEDKGAGIAVSITSDPGLKLPAGYHYVICQSRWVRASANPIRKELLRMK